jgi:hypothetical protein
VLAAGDMSTDRTTHPSCGRSGFCGGTKSPLMWAVTRVCPHRTVATARSASRDSCNRTGRRWWRLRPSVRASRTNSLSFTDKRLASSRTAMYADEDSASIITLARCRVLLLANEYRPLLERVWRAMLGFQPPQDPNLDSLRA